MLHFRKSVSLPFFERQLKVKWHKPTMSRQSSQIVKKLYNLPAFTNEMLQVPLMDTPILALQSSGLLAEDGQELLRDTQDRRIDTALRRCHETTSMARASIVWGRKMIQLLPKLGIQLQEGASRIFKVGTFTTDATLNAMISSSRVMASATMAAMGIWLRVWQADIHLKQIVSAYPFQEENSSGNA